MTSTALLCASAIAESPVPIVNESEYYQQQAVEFVPNPPKPVSASVSVSQALNTFSDSADQCISSAASVLNDSVSQLISLQSQQIAALNESNVLCHEENAQLQDETEMLQDAVSLADQEIDDLNGQLYNVTQANELLTLNFQECEDKNEEIKQGVLDLYSVIDKFSTSVKLANPRFKNGKHWNYGKWDLNPNRAIDGIVASKDVYKSMAHTSSDNEEKIFIVDVDSSAGAHISEITLIPRADCCFDRYQETQVFLQNLDGSQRPSKCSPKDIFDSKFVQAAKTTGLVWSCDSSIAATGIFVVNPNKVHLQITELSAKGLTNPEPVILKESAQLTLSNPRFADGLYYNSGSFKLAPEAAIDGSWINHAWNTGFAHSKSYSNPKFLVDLPSANTVVETVTIYPRNNCCFDRYSKMTVQVADVFCKPAQGLSSSVVKANIEKGLVWNCENASGDHIEVVNKNTAIQIAEIVVVGY